MKCPVFHNYQKQTLKCNWELKSRSLFNNAIISKKEFKEKKKILNLSTQKSVIIFDTFCAAEFLNPTM
jgi:hypothetical protein